MPNSMTHSMLMEHPRWFENQIRNRPPGRVNSTFLILAVLAQVVDLEGSSALSHSSPTLNAISSVCSRANAKRLPHY
jgi:hypothetical protein